MCGGVWGRYSQDDVIFFSALLSDQSVAVRCYYCLIRVDIKLACCVL